MAQKSWLVDLRSSETFLVATVSIALFTDAFIYSLIIPIIPVVLTQRIGIRPEDAQFFVSALLAVYGGTLLIGSPLFGYIADHSRSRKIPFICGLAALGTSTALFAFARTFPILVVARCLQGLSAASVWVVGLALISDNVPSDRVAAAMGQTSIGLTCGFVLGPVLGGVIYDKLGYYASFLPAALLVILDVVLRFAIIEKSDSPPQDKGQPDSYQDYPRAGSYDSFNKQDTGFIPHQDPLRENDAENAPLLKSSVVTNEEGEAQKPNITVLHLLLTPRLPVAMFASVSMALSFSALETVLPLFVMHTFGWSTTGAGLILIVLSLPCFAGVQIGKLIDRVGVRTVGSIGFVISGCGWILMRLITANNTGQVILLVFLLIVLGLSVLITQICSMTEVSQVVGDHDFENPGAFGAKSPIAQAYALYNMSFAGGQVLGPVIAGAVRVNAGWGAMTLVLGLLAGLSAIPMAFFSGPPRRKTEEDENI